MNVATKVVQGKVEEGAEKWHRLCQQTGGGGRRGGCGQRGERDVTVVTDDEVCVNVAAPGDTLGGLACESSTFGNILLKFVYNCTFEKFTLRESWGSCQSSLKRTLLDHHHQLP